MVQIVGAFQRKPSTGARINAGLEEVFNKGEQFRQVAQQREFMQQENEAARRMGLDLTGIHDPKARQEAFKQASKYQQQANMIKQLGLGEDIGLEGPQQAGRQQEPAQREDRINPETGEVDVGNVKIPTAKMIPEKTIQKWALTNPAVADKLQKHNDQIIAEQRHRENLELKEKSLAQREKEHSVEHKREIALAGEQAKSDAVYNKQLQGSAQQHQIKSETLKKLEQLNNKGVTGKPFEKLLEKVGLVNLTSEGRREFSADVKHLITDIRSILGGQFSNFEFQTILNAYPSADFSQGANKAIINNLKEFQDLRHKEFEFAKEIKKENGGKIPLDFQAMVNDRLANYTQERLPDIKANTRKIMHEEYGIQAGHMLMFDPNGDPLDVPEELIDRYIELGATLP